MTVKQLVRIGVSHIEEAILEILFQAGSEYLHRADIAQACGLIASWKDSEWIVYSILDKLEEDGRVTSRKTANGSRTGWKLTLLEHGRRA